jgi:hypothetical protein
MAILFGSGQVSAYLYATEQLLDQMPTQAIDFSMLTIGIRFARRRAWILRLPGQIAFAA